MARLRDLRYRSTLVVFCLALGLSQGCVRSEPLKPATASTSSGNKQKLPFHQEVQQASASEASDPAIAPDPRLPGGLPFPAASRTRVLPAGTLLTVRLENSLSAVSVHGGEVFAASVAAPLVLEGETVIERGARLTLTAITVGGTPLAVQTSSLFSRGTVKGMNVSSSGASLTQTQKSGGTRIPKGRRLTFRLIAPVTLNEPNSPEKPKSLSTTSE